VEKTPSDLQPNIRLLLRQTLCACLLSLYAGTGLWAQSATSGEPLPEAPAPVQENVSLRTVPRDLLNDQKNIWSSPARLHARDIEWLAPLLLATGAAIATDHREAQLVSHDADFNQANLNASNALIGGWIAAPVALYGFGHFRQDDHARQAGLLSGEAMVDGVVVEEAMKFAFLRERPAVDSGRGRFFQSSVGADSSFPSSHSIVAWCAASTLASEYPAPWSQFALYSAATGVSLTRVMGREHFPSDVLVGSATGWLIGHYVAHRHHRQFRKGTLLH
jgi:membrane-associated phospholipid phosphatase